MSFNQHRSFLSLTIDDSFLCFRPTVETHVLNNIDRVLAFATGFDELVYEFVAANFIYRKRELVSVLAAEAQW